MVVAINVECKFGPSLIPGMIWSGEHGEAPCPLPSHTSGDKNPSLLVDLKSHRDTGEPVLLYNCFICGPAARAEGLRVVEAVAEAVGVSVGELLEWRGIDDTFVPNIHPQAPPYADLPTELVPRWHKWLVEVGGAYLSYSKGLSLDTIRRFELGCNLAGMYSYPVYSDGELVQVRKYFPSAPKAKRRSHITGRGTWLYPDVPDGWVLLCEGENDALIGRQYGLPTLTTTGGVGCWKDEWSEALSGRRVAICFDCDTPARLAARDRARSLRSEGCDVVIIDIAPRRKDGYDLNDHLRRRQSPDRVLALVDAAAGKGWTRG